MQNQPKNNLTSFLTKLFNIIERVKNLFQYKNPFLMHCLDTVIVSKMHEKIESRESVILQWKLLKDSTTNFGSF